METQVRQCQGTSAPVFCFMALVLALTTSGLVNLVGADGASSGKKVALLIIDVQECFLPGGSLSVNEGNEVIPVINWIREAYEDKFSVVAVTKDWHCARHVSFASSHSGKTPFEDVTLREINQTLWPDHCVQNVGSGPTSSKLDATLKREASDVDFYSSFYDIGRFGMTNLHSTLQSHGIDTIIITGLALDYCVKYSALDGQFLGYKVYVVQDATRSVAMDTSNEALTEFSEHGIDYIDTTMLGGVLRGAASTEVILSPALVSAWLCAYLLL
ncbi:hypothetical protein EGW08_021382 [Elysia chlorotica]|uniref:nicotinamidase n=1 Tax=Elysia chlorotica TaxID=188477 RepID=A0A3S0ZMG6_ELYCH|nr:hypothetical protein EGW08_021382 [Elysia chlorotica]